MNCSLRHPRRQRNRAFGILVWYTSSVTPAIEYALGAMLCFGLGDLIYKRAGGAGAQPHHLLMVQSWLFTLLVVVFGLATRSLTWTAGTAWGALAGAVVVLGAASAWAWAGPGMPDTPICRFLGHTARVPFAQESPR